MRLSGIEPTRFNYRRFYSAKVNRKRKKIYAISFVDEAARKTGLLQNSMDPRIRLRGPQRGQFEESSTQRDFPAALVIAAHQRIISA